MTASLARRLAAEFVGTGLLVTAVVGIAAAYWFTSSTSFANPAVIVGRAFTDTFAGIAPSSVPGFVAAQVAGAAIGVAAVAVFYPDRRAASDVAVPTTHTSTWALLRRLIVDVRARG